LLSPNIPPPVEDAVRSALIIVVGIPSFASMGSTAEF
jgi:hypothetical protein